MIQRYCASKRRNIEEAYGVWRLGSHRGIIHAVWNGDTVLANAIVIQKQTSSWRVLLKRFCERCHIEETTVLLFKWNAVVLKKPTAKLTETSSEFCELHKLGGNYGATIQMNAVVLTWTALHWVAQENSTHHMKWWYCVLERHSICLSQVQKLNLTIGKFYKPCYTVIEALAMPYHMAFTASEDHWSNG